jgi:fucose 4-O-acetylase-like acetyltransferase
VRSLATASTHPSDRANLAADTSRVGWVDYARGLGILLVVIGHTLRGLMTSGIQERAGWAVTLDEWIYAFHMPLFFALSGLFASKLAARSGPQILRDRLAGVVYPYLLWSTLQTLVQVALSRYTNTPAQLSGLVGILYAPVMQFWFLYALLLVSLAYVALVKLGLPEWSILLLSAVISLGPDFGAIGVWGLLASCKHNFFYYVLGAVLAQRLLHRVPPRPLVCLLGGTLGFTLLTALLWSSPPERSGVATMLGALLGMAATVLVSMAIARISSLRWLAYCGLFSLQIYVAHTLASAGVRIAMKRVGVHDPSVHLVLGTLAGIVLPILLLQVVNKIGFKYAFTWPIARATRNPPPTDAQRSIN